MKINNPDILKKIFYYKGYLKPGISPVKKIFDGIEIAPYKNNASAAICISSDFEMNWAFRRHRENIRDLHGIRTRNNFGHIIKLLNEFEVPITWATVGHLFLSECTRGAGGLAHSNMPRPPRNNFWNGDWYKHDPCSNVKSDPLWYAPDLIEDILESKVGHEIGTHTFSHIDFSPDCSNRMLVYKEIEECILAMKPFGIKPRSLVFPRNQNNYSYLDIFSELGIVAVRHRDESIRLSYPERTGPGIYKIYETIHLRSPNYYNLLDAFIIYLNSAISHHAVLHLWFHPSDPIECFDNEFHDILEYISLNKNSMNIWIVTMGELVSYCEAVNELKIKVFHVNNEVEIYLESTINHLKYGNPDVCLIFKNGEMPKVITINLHDKTVQLSRDNYFIRNNDVLINVPILAKCVKLFY